MANKTARKPNARQAKAAELIAKCSISKAEALRRAGYSEATCRQPSAVLKSETFRGMLDEVVPDEMLAYKLNTLLNAQKPHGTDSDFIMVDDNTVQLNTAKAICGLKGHGNAEVSGTANGVAFTIKIGNVDENGAA